MSINYELITRNLQEIIGEEDLKKHTTPLKIYWGTATTGKPHIAYFLPLLKLRDFVLANCEITILLADIHAFLDNLKAPIETIEHRTSYYEKLITVMLLSIGVTNIKFVRGSTFQLSKEYTFDLYKLSTLTSQHDSVKAGAQVVKQVSNPLLSSLIYPSMQALDEEYLKVDAQFGGVDQRKIFTYANKYLPLMGYKKRIHLMNPMIPGLNSEKMSSSDKFSKIDFEDTHSQIKKKIRKCFCEEGNKDNGMMALLKHILFPIYEIRKKRVVISRRDLEDVEVKDYNELENLFVERKIHPSDLKENVANMVEEVVRPVREGMEEYREIAEKAYPENKKINKKK